MAVSRIISDVTTDKPKADFQNLGHTFLPTYSVLILVQTDEHGWRNIVGTKWIKSCLLPCFGTFKMLFLMFISILVFLPEGKIWNPVRRDTRIYVRRILNASRISKTQLNPCTISPS